MIFFLHIRHCGTLPQQHLKRTSSSGYGNYITITDAVTQSGNSFSYSNLELCSLDANSSYDFQIYIRDQLNTLSGVNLYFTVPQGTPLVALQKKKIGINTPTSDAALNRALKQGAAVLAKEARHAVGCHFHRPCAAHADGSRMLRADSAAVRECFRRHKPRDIPIALRLQDQFILSLLQEILKIQQML